MSNKMNSGINYSVNEEKRTVAAYVADGYNNVYREVRCKLFRVNSEVGCAFVDSKQVRSVVSPKNMVMVAKCHPNDVWDEEKGKAIARAKLLAHESNIRLSLYAIAYNIVEEWLCKIDILGDKEYDRNQELAFERDAHCGFVSVYEN